MVVESKEGERMGRRYIGDKRKNLILILITLKI
jgi:hypothetical protein